MATIDPATGLPVQNTTTAISTNQLKPVTPLNVTTPQVDTSLYTTGLNSALSDLQNGVDTQQANVDLQNKQAMNQNSAIANLQAQAGGKAQDITSTYQDTGVTNLFNQLKDINAQAQGLNLEAQAIPIQTQQEYTGRLATQAGTSAIDAGKLRENALKALSLGQQAAIASANYDKAKNYADQLVEAKYAGLEAEIKAKQTNLDGLDKYVLTPAQQKLKDSQAVLLKRQEQELADKKADEIKSRDLILSATPYAPKELVNKANALQQQGKSSVEVAIALGKYAGDYLGDLVKRSAIAKNNIEYEKTVKEIKALNQVPAISAPVGSTAYSQASWLNSAVNKESLAVGEREKISKSFAVTQQLGNLARNLQKDQTSFFGGKVREIMAAIGADKDAGTIQAQITALVPQVARGTYGEVGVLTNADVKNYRQVIGNLSSPNDQNKAVTAMTLVALRNGVKAQLDTAAASKLDVSRFVPMYQDLTNQINAINDDIGVNDIHVKEYADKNPQVKPMVEELIKNGAKGSEILQVLGVEN